MKKLFFFSTNKNKIDEISKILENSKFEILNLFNFKHLESPEESGKSFEENAKIKSLYGFEKTQLPCFADDSGFCVKSINNFPGVMSKRFLEKNNGIENSLKILLDKVKFLPNREAFFKTSISFNLNKNNNLIFNGIIEGIISKEPRGINGFGYDPIFIPKGFNKTFAEMTLKEKNKISHRFLAVKKFENFLRNYSTKDASPL